MFTPLQRDGIAIDTTSVPASDDVLVLAAGGSAATQTDVNNARDVVTAAIDVIAGVGFQAGLDDLHHAGNSATDFDGKISILQTALGVLNQFTVLAGTTNSVILTDCIFPTDTWKGQLLISLNPSIQPISVATRILSQSNAGTFIVDPLPWVPDTGDLVIVRSDIAPAIAAELATSQSAITTAITASTTTVNAHSDTVATALPAAINTALGTSHGVGAWTTATGFATPTNVTDSTTAVNAHTDTVATALPAAINTALGAAHGTGQWITATGFATPANVTDARDAIETYGDIHWPTANISTLATSTALTTALTSLTATIDARTITITTAITAVPTAVWTVPLPGSFLTGSAGALLALAGALVVPGAVSVATAVWAAQEGTPASGSYGYGLKLLRMLTTNRVEETAGNPGTATLYADDDTVYKTWTLRDGTGGPVTSTVGEPARRSVAS